MKDGAIWLIIVFILFASLNISLYFENQKVIEMAKLGYQQQTVDHRTIWVKEK